MLLVAWERLTFLPAFLFEISDDMQPGGFGGLIPPELAHGFNARNVVAQLAVAHSMRWLAGEFIQPAVDFRERFAQLGNRLGAVLFKGGHYVAWLSGCGTRRRPFVRFGRLGHLRHHRSSNRRARPGPGGWAM